MPRLHLSQSSMTSTRMLVMPISIGAVVRVRMLQTVTGLAFCNQLASQLQEITELRNIQLAQSQPYNAGDVMPSLRRNHRHTLRFYWMTNVSLCSRKKKKSRLLLFLPRSGSLLSIVIVSYDPLFRRPLRRA